MKRIHWVGAALLGGAIAAGCGSESADDAAPQAKPEVATTTQAVTLPGLDAVADTSLREALPYANDGLGSNISVSSKSGAMQYTLVRFDQTAIAAALGSQSLYRAQIEFTIADIPAGWGGGELSIHRMTMTWPEGNGTGAPPGSSGPSTACSNDTDTSLFGNLFDNCTTANRWGILPGDPDPSPFVAAPTDTARLYSNGMTKLRFDVSPDIRAFLGGTPNFGFIVSDTAGPLHGEWVNFKSRETGQAPKLILDVRTGSLPVGSGQDSARCVRVRQPGDRLRWRRTLRLRRAGTEPRRGHDLASCDSVRQ